MNVFQVFTLNIFKSILKHSQVFFIKSNHFSKLVLLTSEREFRQGISFSLSSFLVSKLRAESLVSSVFDVAALLKG